MKSKLIMILILFIICPLVYAEGTVTQGEINHLLSFISTSDCVFNRNGSEYPSKEAFEHINKKYKYVLKKGLIKTTEDFIKYSATKSSISGKKYTVLCSGKKILSEEWLKKELEKYRSELKK